MVIALRLAPMLTHMKHIYYQKSINTGFCYYFIEAVGHIALTPANQLSVEGQEKILWSPMHA
jgi:hypothetical protein